METQKRHSMTQPYLHGAAASEQQWLEVQAGLLGGADFLPPLSFMAFAGPWAASQSRPQNCLFNRKNVSCSMPIARNSTGLLGKGRQKMAKSSAQTEQPLLLRDATVQEIQLELIRRTRPGEFNMERVLADLAAHRNLWEAAMMDTFCFSNPGKLPRIGLIKLRDLPENFWNADSLYILTPDVESARSLVEIAEHWGGMVLLHDDLDDVQSALGGTGRDQAVVSVWWD